MTTGDKVLGFGKGTKMGLSGGKGLSTILGDFNGFTLGLDVGTEIKSIYESFDGFNDVEFEGLCFVGSLGSKDGKVIGFDKDMNLGFYDGKVLDTILVNVYGITLGLDVGTELVSLDGSFDGFSYGILDGLFLADALGYTDGKVNVSDADIKLVYTDGKIIGSILRDVDGITLGLDVGTDLGSLDG